MCGAGCSGSGCKDDWGEADCPSRRVFLKELISKLDFREDYGIQSWGRESMNAGEIGEHFLKEISCKMFQEVDGLSNRIYSMQLGRRMRLTGGNHWSLC